MEIITGVVQDYPWGSSDAIPKLLGTPNTGEPQAEYWLGAHSKAPATLATGDLLDHLTEHPEQIGQASLDRLGHRLPFLLKVLSAERALSLQAHPSREQAEDGFAREDADQVPRDADHRNYRDDWPKPEMIVALTEFEGLCGFRDPQTTRQLFARLGVREADELVDPLADHDGLMRVFLEILALADAEKALIEQVATAARAGVDEPGEFGLFCRTAVELYADYPGDAGVLAALLLNRITLSPGEALFLPAGNLHAYLRGTGIEIMASSDNVLRGGLTGKHIDIDELAQVVDFVAETPEVIRPETVSPGILRYPTPAPEFALFEIDHATDQPLPGDGSARILLTLDGETTVRSGEDRLDLGKGVSGFVGAQESGLTVSCTGRCVLASSGV